MSEQFTPRREVGIVQLRERRVRGVAPIIGGIEGTCGRFGSHEHCVDEGIRMIADHQERRIARQSLETNDVDATVEPPQRNPGDASQERVKHHAALSR